MENIIYPKLISREIEICDLVRKGASQEEIAETLQVSVGTIRKHIYKISSKLSRIIE
ncbi:MAG: HTH domain-containing protein [candidate division Zixibacteria bacterium]|nr:HTH domain-containing protein [candidate division Zixibacteria bacterium]